MWPQLLTVVFLARPQQPLPRRSGEEPLPQLCVSDPLSEWRDHRDGMGSGASDAGSAASACCAQRDGLFKGGQSTPLSTRCTVL